MNIYGIWNIISESNERHHHERQQLHDPEIWIMLEEILKSQHVHICMYVCMYVWMYIV